jgi:putative ABC transport system permease protein
MAAVLLTRVLAGILYQVSATDPLTFVAVAAILGTVAVAACLAPTRKALSIDPIVTLRYE